MVQRQGGSRKKSRHKISKRSRDAGKVTITRILKKFKEGDKVVIKIESAIHGGMPHSHYHGRHGQIVGMQGTNYLVKVKDLNKEKVLILAPAHMNLA